MENGIGVQTILNLRMPSSGMWLQPPAKSGSSHADFPTLKMEAIRSSETSVQFTRSTRRHIPEDGILHSNRGENLKSYTIIKLCLRNLRGFNVGITEGRDL
jgi:hypothetical protein